MANKFVYCVCFALAISHLTLPFDVCQPEAFWFMKRVLLFQSYQEKLKIPYATFHECSRPVPWAWAGEMGWGWRSTSCMMGNVKMVNLSLHWTKVSLLYYFIVIIQVEICLYLVRRGKLLGVIITSDLSWNDHVNEGLRSILVYARLFSFMLCPSIYGVSLSGSKQGHYQSFSPVCLMTRHLMKPVFQPLFHIARTYVSTFLTLPTATGITNSITSY